MDKAIQQPVNSLEIMQDSLISIIIPVYNTESYLSKCLDSIIGQTYTNWEAILVNDGSLDNCGKICDEYAAKDNRFKVLHQENKGVVNARNNAISNAKGEYLAFVDSDDFIEASMLNDMIEAGKLYSADIVWCNLNSIYKDKISKDKISIHEENEQNIKDLLTNKIPGYLWNKMIKRSFWEKCNIVTDERACMWEDTYISLQMLVNNPRNIIIDKELYNYVKYNDYAATLKTGLPIIVKAERNIVNIYHFLKEKGLFNKYFKEFSALALKLKIEMLPYDMNKAMYIFAFSHKKFQNFKFNFIVSYFYWIGFNCHLIGRLLFKIKFKQVSR